MERWLKYKHGLTRLTTVSWILRNGSIKFRLVRADSHLLQKRCTVMYCIKVLQNTKDVSVFFFTTDAYVFPTTKSDMLKNTSSNDHMVPSVKKDR